MTNHITNTMKRLNPAKYLAVPLLSACVVSCVSPQVFNPNNIIGNNTPIVNQPIYSQNNDQYNSVPNQDNYQNNHQNYYGTNTSTQLVPFSTPATKFYNFNEWRDSFINRAIQAGYNPTDVNNLMSKANYNYRTISNDSSQAEFVKMPWQYIENAVNSLRIKEGQKKLHVNQYIFNDIGTRYPVPPKVVTAIWGVETSYGRNMGNANLVSTLSTLAYDGRRRQFAETQLLSLLALINRGDLSWNTLKGSWAGAMGHTQFIPQTWLNHGVDGNTDGYRDPWTTSDALHSTASYLSAAGWMAGVEPYYEVQLPEFFDYNLIGETYNLSQWQSIGLTLLDGRVDSRINAKLWLPAGAEGPALLTTKNFDVIKVYNNSNNYALSVSLLAKKINKQVGLIKPWPKHQKPLTNKEVEELQEALTYKGYDTKGIDGKIGSNTKKAFQRWQNANGKRADGFITRQSTREFFY